MRFWLPVVLLLASTGCAATRWVDKKGRDCVRHLVYPGFLWDTCEVEATPLAAERIETEQKVKVDATVQSPTR